MKKYRSSYFLLSDFVSDFQEDAVNTRFFADVAAGNRIQFAVPKKLLKRAVDRNAVRRVARESWRARFRQFNGVDRFMSKHHQIRIRLVARPPEFQALSRPARKRFWRTELDDLIARVLR